MAQAGMFVPASKFTYWPYQYLFTRIRNNDDIYAGLSSFEVEMKEFKVILKYSNENSMILGDELCSGTETLDATALVASGLQQLCKRRANFIFATHLHFLSELKEVTELPNMKFYHLSVRADPQNPDKLIYDRKLAVGNGPQSYGIVVCKSMALDTEFVREAERIRLAIERGDVLGHIKFTPRQTAGASKYNTEKRFGACEVCDCQDGSDIHHINQQCNADSRGIISSDGEGMFHKNSKWNLVCLCKDCHQAVHSSPPTLQISGYIQTSTGIELEFRKIDTSLSKPTPASNQDSTEAMIISMYRDNKTFRAIQRKVNEVYGSKIKLTEIENIVKNMG
jgi:DNA mismatch repair protein MutS